MRAYVDHWNRKYTKINFYIKIMKSLNNFAESLRYEAPAVEVVEISVERGFEASQVSDVFGLGDATYTDEDVIW